MQTKHTIALKRLPVFYQPIVTVHYNFGITLPNLTFVYESDVRLILD